MTRRLALVVVAAVAVVSLPAGRSVRGAGIAVTDAEQKLLQTVDANNAAALALLERVVNINSGTQNFDGVKRVAEVFRAELDALGFKTTWVDGAGWQRAGHLVANHPGAGPRILLIGHLDTVFPSTSPFQKFERVDGNKARGPGVIDMKGGDVIMLSALKALQAVGALARANIVVVMTGDEEEPGTPLATARQPLIDAAAGAQYALGFEDGPGDPRFAVTARRGASRWALEVTATAAHSSQIFRSDVGFGAIFEASRILNGFRERLAGEPHLTFNPGVIVGGTAVTFDGARSSGTAAGQSNVVAAEARVTGDLRALSVEQLERARARMREVASQPLAGAKSVLTFEDGYPPMAPSDGNARLLSLYNEASGDAGAGPVAAADPDRAGAADVSFVAGRVPSIIDGIGLSGSDDHTPNETADLRALPSQTKRAALLLFRLSQGAARGR